VDLAWIKTGVQSWSKMKAQREGEKGAISNCLFIFCIWKNFIFLGKLDQHFSSSSHVSSMYRLSIFKNKHSNVEYLLSANQRLANQKEESMFKINKKIIETFFDCTLFLTKQGLAFRRDPQEHGNFIINRIFDHTSFFFIVGNFIQLIHLLRRYHPLLDSWFNQGNFKSHHVRLIYIQFGLPLLK